MTTYTFAPRAVLHVAAWAAQECDRQRSGELSVEWMVAGWHYAIARADQLPTEHDILKLGAIVEPRLNVSQHYRKCNVQIGGSVKMPWLMVPEAMMKLVGFLTDPDATVEPDEWFRQYEEIHPWRDGNGRTGSILHNWLRGTLDQPGAPPDFWSGKG